MNDEPNARESRQEVVLPARMRADADPVDICIRDISSRGMVVEAASPPPRGTYVEIWQPANTIAGRVIWVKDRRFGIRTRDPMDVGAIVDQLPQRRRAADSPEGASADTDQPLITYPKRRATDVADRYEGARRVSRRFEYSLMILCGIFAAGFLGRFAFDAVSAPQNNVTTELR